MRLQNFLFCIPIRSSGFSIVCFNFILFGVVIYNYVLLPLLKIVHGAALIALAVFIVGLILVLVFYTLEFLDGMDEKKINQMVVYRFLCLIKLVAVVIGTAFFLMDAKASKSNDQKSVSNRNFYDNSNEDRDAWISAVSGRNQTEQRNLTTESTKPTKTLAIVFQILYAVLEIYIYSCITSLFLEIEEETKPKEAQIVFNQQQPETSQGHQPYYNESLHPVQPPRSPVFRPPNSPAYQPHSPAHQMHSPAHQPRSPGHIALSPNQPGCSNVTIIPLHARNR